MLGKLQWESGGEGEGKRGKGRGEKEKGKKEKGEERGEKGEGGGGNEATALQAASEGEREKETLATLLLIPRWSREQVFSVCVRARVKVFVLPLCISVFECEHVGMHMYLWVLLCV